MAMEGLSKCVIRECGGLCSKGANLCDQHRVSGMVMKCGNSTFVVTAWYAEHAQEAGIVVLNDYTLGLLFGGAPGFMAKLGQQGFVNVQSLPTPEEFEAARGSVAKAPSRWSGPWLTDYPWETTTRNGG